MHLHFNSLMASALTRYLVMPNQRREDMMSRRSDNLYALITFQGQESWMQVTRISLWTKSRWAHGVFYSAKAVWLV